MPPTLSLAGWYTRQLSGNIQSFSGVNGTVTLSPVLLHESRYVVSFLFSTVSKWVKTMGKSSHLKQKIRINNERYFNYYRILHSCEGKDIHIWQKVLLDLQQKGDQLLQIN